jgi:hypothetical protein
MIDNKQVNNKITKESFNPKLHVAEYKRVCNGCNKVWHSLVERETKLDTSKANCCNDQDMANECSFITNAQARRNIQSREDSLSELRKCPVCGSNNYTETIEYYNKR